MNQGIEIRIIYSHNEEHKQVSTTATQTDDNGCTNGYTSMYINTDPSHVSNTSDITLPPQQTGIEQDERQSLQASTAIKNIVEHNNDHIGHTDNVSNISGELMEMEERKYLTDLVASCSRTTDVESCKETCGQGHHSEYPATSSKDDNCCYGDDISNHGDMPTVVYKQDEDIEVIGVLVEQQFTGTVIESCETSDSVGEESVNYGGAKVTKKRPRHKKKTNTTHKMQEHHECSVCNKVFKLRSSLERHNIIHTENDYFECSYCKKRFAQKCHYEIHLRTHTGVKPFECPCCEKRFIDKSGLTKHTKRLSERAVDCDFCEKKFCSKKLLKAHVKTHNYPD